MARSNLYTALDRVYTNEAEAFLAESEDHSFSLEFQRKMQKLIKRRRRPYYQIVNTVGKRVACFVLCLAVVSSVTVMNVDAVRNGFLNFMPENYVNKTVFHPVDAENAPETLEELYEITYDLSDFEIYHDEYWEDEHWIIYDQDNTLSVSFRQDVKKGFENTGFSAENAVLETVMIHEYEAIYYEWRPGHHTLIWDNGDYIFVIHTNLSKSALIEIAESVQKVE